MKGIYLACFQALHEKHDIVYQDINGKRDLGGDMMDIDLSKYDYVIATPPCNYWSRANYRRNISKYALETKHLLPDILHKLIRLGKPFIVENVRNLDMFAEAGLFDLPCFIYFIGQHTYWTNIILCDDIFQVHHDKQNISRNKRQGGLNVHNVIEQFIDQVEVDEM